MGVCDCCEKPSDELASSFDGECQVCPDCIKILVVCPKCERVADWELHGDSWVCAGPNGCGLAA